MRVTSGAELSRLPRERPVLVLVGGADGMAAEPLAALGAALADLVPVLDELGAVVVDGGTDTGVMRAAGRARAAAGGRFPLIGVVADGVTATYEPNHTDLVLVPGDRWGAEAPWLADVAGVVAGSRPSVTVLANGGGIAYEDAALSLARGRRLVVVRGTGRTADAIAGRAGPRAARIAASPLTAVVGLPGLVAHVGRVLREAGGA
ncbi:hypothetical protein [Saccharothrix australiensis]|uniref:LSDAT prokaryote domain-containing protein n=1 Tax=Saccharothrix australiensis TaxID=2072 RepID=A0A495W6J5_9PSEU|nr:hypothetical protein [Saccharothrix australiensis]RKT56283.1 hypothetical protein C8E97_4976 [Saccharothrix australiensis]